MQNGQPVLIDMNSLKNTLAKLNAVEGATAEQHMQSARTSAYGAAPWPLLPAGGGDAASSMLGQPSAALGPRGAMRGGRRGGMMRGGGRGGRGMRGGFRRGYGYDHQTTGSGYSTRNDGFN